MVNVGNGCQFFVFLSSGMVEEGGVTRVLGRKDDSLKYFAIEFNGQKWADSDLSQKSSNSR